jgi:type II secretory pathway component PulK
VPVLQSVNGITLEAAQAIYNRRKVKPFKTPQDISRELGLRLEPMALNYLSLTQSNYFTLTASAHGANSKIRRVIRTIIFIEPGSARLYRTLYWNENVPDYEGTAP